MIVMRADGHVLALERRIAAFKYGNNILSAGRLGFQTDLQAERLTRPEVEGLNLIVCHGSIEERGRRLFLALKHLIEHTRRRPDDRNVLGTAGLEPLNYNTTALRPGLAAELPICERVEVGNN